jgi:hypothetical protein
MKYLKSFNESFYENFKLIGKIESSYPNGQKTPNFYLIISQIEELIDEKMDELIGKGDYTVGYSEEQNRFIVFFREGDIETSCKMADEVANYVNIERNRLRVGNCGKSMFWLTWID